MELLAAVGGAAVIALALVDIFQTLFHPTGHGPLSRTVSRGVWSAAQILHREHRPPPRYAGPLGFVIVLGLWAAMLIVGWAIVFWPHLPEGFNVADPLVASEQGSFADALYVSLTNLTGVGYGDISPASTGLRILAPVETLFGLALLTASITWLVSIYTAVTRRETLTREVHLMREAEQRLGKPIGSADPELLGAVLAAISTQVIAVRRDLIQQPITHYFQSAHDRQLRDELREFLRELVDRAGDDAPPALRLRAEILSMALDDFEATIREHWPNDV